MVTRLKRVGLVAAMAVVGLNIWTGSPLLAVWIGSRIQGHSGAPKMGPVFAVIVCLILFSLLLAQALARLGAMHDRVTGRAPRPRRTASWLRSMRAERSLYPGEHMELTGLDRVLVVVVVLAAAAFEVWFFFFSGSPI